MMALGLCGNRRQRDRQCRAA